MRAYINIFLTLVMPLSIISTGIAIGYFSIDFDFNEAVKLGILTGVIASVAFSSIMALVILIFRAIQKNNFTKQIKTEKHKKTASPTKRTSTSKSMKSPNYIVKTFMILMDKEMAYEVSLNAIHHENIADICEKDEEEKSIYLRIDKEEINIKFSTLTTHTTQVLISSTKNKNNIIKIITALKEKEHSFMKY